MTNEVWFCEMAFAIKGDYPKDIPISPSVDMDALKEDDPSPFFVTLPIGQVGGKSPNRSVPYDLAEMQSVVDQVMEKRPEGRLGHLKLEERGSRYDLPSLRWIGAKIDANGKVWGKAYVPQYATSVRQHLRSALATNAKVGVSIYGKADMSVETGKFVRLNLETIDLVDPERVGLKEATAVPVITSEMEDEKSKGRIMPEATHEVLFQEYKSTIDTKTIQIQELNQQLAAAQEAGKTANTVVVQLQEMLGKDADIVKAVGALVEANRELAQENFKATVDSVIAEMVEVEEARPAVKRMIPAGLTSKKDVEKAVEGLLKEEDVSEMISNYVRKNAGGAAIVTGKDNRQNSTKIKIEDTEENRNAARGMFGF